MKIKLATVKNPRDNTPTVREITLDELYAAVRAPRKVPANYGAYHFQKAELKRLTALAQQARERGALEDAKALKQQAALYKKALDNTKFGKALLPYLYKDDATYVVKNDTPHRAGVDAITHFTLLILDVESGTTLDELHAVLHPYTYLVWTTISHRPDDPRYRVVLIPAAPIPVEDAQALIRRIDAHLPARNAPGKALQCLDPVSVEAARLHFTPAWLIGHPEQYHCALHHGTSEQPFITADAYPLSEEQQAALDARRALAEQQRERQKEQALLLLQHPPANGEAPLFIKGTNKVNPEYYFETADGYVQMKSITHKISNVRCPLHADAIGSEFIDINNRSGIPQFRCAKCNITLKMHPLPNPDDVDVDATPILEFVRKKAPSAELASVRARPPQTTEAAFAPLLEYEQHTITRINERYLPSINLALPERGMLFVKSPKGTGKTEGIVSIVQEAKQKGKSVILLTHRISLARNLSNRTGMLNYQDLPPGTLTDYVVVCVNSLSTRLDELEAQYDIVIIDESEQVLRNLQSATLKKILSDVFTKIVKLVSSAKQVVCLDADLSSDMTIELICKMRNTVQQPPSEDYKGIINTYKTGTGKRIKIFANRYELIASAFSDIANGEKVYIACSTAKAAHILGAIAIAEGKNTLVVSSDTSQDAEVQNFQTNPTELCKQYDVVVASPSMQTGFSIDGEHFTRIYGHFETVQGITYLDYDQALSRVRQCDDVSVFIQGNDTELDIQPREHYTQSALTKEAKTLKRLPTELAFTPGQRLWAEVEGTIEYLTRLWSNHRDAQFIEMKQELGYEIALAQGDEEAGKMLWDCFKDVGADKASRVFGAQILDDGEYLDVVRKNHKTNEEHLAIERYRIQQLIDAPLTLELTQQALKEKLIQTISKVRALVIASDADRTHYDMQERERHHTAFTKAAHNTIEHELLIKHLAAHAGLDIEELYEALADGKAINITDDILDKVFDAYAERRDDFRHFFRVQIQTDEESKQKRRKQVWDATLGKIGLPLSKKRVQADGRQAMRYFLDPARVELTSRAVDIAKDLFVSKL